MDLLVVYNIDIEINTAPEGTTEKFVRFGAGFDNMSEELNEVVNQYFFLDGEGFAQNFVTGMAPTYTLTGVRIIGDAGQDYIFAADRKFGTLKKRNTTLKISRLQADGNIVVITCPITLANMSDMVGASTDGASVSVEMRMNGKPTISSKAASNG